MDEHVKSELQHVTNHIEDLHMKTNTMGQAIAVLETTAEFHKESNARLFAEISGIGTILGSIRESITELEAQLKTMCDRLGKMEVATEKKPSSVKVGFWANMADWKSPLPWIVCLVIVAAYASGTTLADWLGAPIKVGP